MEPNKELSAEIVLNKRIKQFPGYGEMNHEAIKRNVLASMEEYANQWKQKFEDLDNSTAKQFQEMGDAYERLYNAHAELKAENERLKYGAEVTRDALTNEQAKLKALKAEHTALKEKAEAYEKALKIIKEQAENGIFPHLPVETVGAAMCININNLATEVLLSFNSSTNNKKENNENGH